MGAICGVMPRRAIAALQRCGRKGNVRRTPLSALAITYNFS
jgi:hypothetical protein